jgi:hypothetical protein
MGDFTKRVANTIQPGKKFRRRRTFMWNAATSNISGLVWPYFSPMYLAANNNNHRKHHPKTKTNTRQLIANNRQLIANNRQLMSREPELKKT